MATIAVANSTKPNMTTRRDFLKTTAGSALLAGLSAACARAVSETPTPARRMSLLVLGGTGFIGPHLVRHAVSRGHQVTILTRGRREAELPAEVERLIGDRNGQLGALVGRKWDAVVDDSATNPDWVRQSTELLKGNVGSYLFTSSTGVYYPYRTRPIDESTPVLYEAADPKDGSATYGANKAQCERLVQAAFGERAFISRPTYIVGPGDTTDRFPYWPVRLAKGGEVLAPGKRDDPTQLIDVRDLTEFMIALLERGNGGVYNVARSPLAAWTFYDEAAKAIDANVTLTRIEDYDFLEAHKIQYSVPWALAKGDWYGMMSVKNDRAVAAGLQFRPLATTVRDTLAWWQTVPEARRTSPKFAITPELEAKALADWHALGH
jgi:2'-hydroxyisoflavone reductase